MLRALPKSVLSSHIIGSNLMLTADWSRKANLKSRLLFVQQVKRLLEPCTQNGFSHGGTYRFSLINGQMSFDGRCVHEYFYALLNFFGKRGILLMQRKQRLCRKPYKCLIYMQRLQNTIWPSPSGKARSPPASDFLERLKHIPLKP